MLDPSLALDRVAVGIALVGDWTVMAWAGRCLDGRSWASLESWLGVSGVVTPISIFKVRIVGRVNLVA